MPYGSYEASEAAEKRILKLTKALKKCYKLTIADEVPEWAACERIAAIIKEALEDDKKDA